MDLLLLLMTVIWGSNYTIVKEALREIPPHPYNAIRLTIASCTLLIAIGIAHWYKRPSVFYTSEPLTRRDWLALFGLGVFGHFIYQICFVGGLARTSVANSSLILAVTPVAIAAVGALRHDERAGVWHWLGALLSIVGIYLVVSAAGAAGRSASSLTGDLLMFACVVCWSIYTVGAGRLMVRHSPLGVTGLSMTIGTLLYVPVALPGIRLVDWSQVSLATLSALVYSSVFAIAVCYMIWYTAVQKIGGTRTSIYSNLVPIVALAVAVIWRGEPLGAAKSAGAALVLAGVAITRAAARLKAAPAQE